MSNFTVALTGGIGSGKSTAANYFKELGATVIDADQITREIVKPESKLLKEIVKKCGADILSEDGYLDRKLLRKIVFQNSDLKKWLEKLLHPIVYQKIFEHAKQAESLYCILVIPLLIETLNTKYDSLFNIIKARNIEHRNNAPAEPESFIDRILVVDAPEQLRKKRIQERDNISGEDAEKIIDSQATQEQRLLKASDVIENIDDLTKLKNRVNALHLFYKMLAKQALKNEMQDG